MTSKRPMAVLFDLDGTLIDSISLLLKCVHHAFEGRSPAPTDEEWIATLGTPLGRQLADYIDSDEEIAAVTSKYRSFQRERHDAFTKAYPGVTETLDKLNRNGHPMGIVTSKSNEMMDRGLEWLGVLDMMQTRIGMNSCEIHKPDPFPVTLALTELGYEPHEAVFVGDSPHDIKAGNAAGVVSVAALWGPFTREQLESSKPQVFIENISELPALMESLASR
ncbi:MAG: HAD-IA family hydrolase [Gemmatimonadaceae bacterium]